MCADEVGARTPLPRVCWDAPEEKLNQKAPADLVLFNSDPRRPLPEAVLLGSVRRCTVSNFDLKVLVGLRARGVPRVRLGHF